MSSSHETRALFSFLNEKVRPPLGSGQPVMINDQKDRVQARYMGSHWTDSHSHSSKPAGNKGLHIMDDAIHWHGSSLKTILVAMELCRPKDGKESTALSSLSGHSSPYGVPEHCRRWGNSLDCVLGSPNCPGHQAFTEKVWTIFQAYWAHEASSWGF